MFEGFCEGSSETYPKMERENLISALRATTSSINQKEAASYLEQV